MIDLDGATAPSLSSCSPNTNDIHALEENYFGILHGLSTSAISTEFDSSSFSGFFHKSQEGFLSSPLSFSQLPLSFGQTDLEFSSPTASEMPSLQNPATQASIVPKSGSVTRLRLNRDQISHLLVVFQTNPFPPKPLRNKLAIEYGATEKQIRFWFQNRRATLKSNGIHVRKPKNCRVSSIAIAKSENRRRAGEIVRQE
ncbi:hypothetical protein BDR26DRAFT_1008026 [Obelidium mucronatum]|nr:hypothetical protein BDR26DRAFT_1008026 [Obelidium mucronatum]